MSVSELRWGGAGRSDRVVMAGFWFREMFPQEICLSFILPLFFILPLRIYMLNAL